jgi:proteic killer suppression protein
MIRSFRSKALRRFAETGNASRLPATNDDRVRRMLARLDASSVPTDMDLPGYKLHLPRGVDKGRYSVWVTANYRLTFGRDGVDAIEVDLEDYH